MSRPPRRPVRPAHRTESIRYAVRDVIALAESVARTGREMLYLNIGDPNLFGFEPPVAMIDATVAAMRANRNGYAPSSGIPEAIAAINRDAERKGIRSIVHTFVTSGASEAIDLALAALADPGDNVLTPSPGYPLYTAVLAKLGVENRAYFLDEEDGWQPDLADIRARINERTRAIVLINPNNPTGSVCSRRTLEGLVELCRETGIVLFADEIYDRLILDENIEFISAASLSNEARVITFGGLSKVYVAPGFRIGWGIMSGPEAELAEFAEAIRKMERARLSANHPEQYAIAPLLDGPHDHLPPLLERLRAQRDCTVRRLNAIPGVSCVSPQGAFYAFPRIDIGIADETFCRQLIAETGVVVVPGSGFGQRPGTQHFRVVFLPDLPQLERAYDAIAQIASGTEGRLPANRV